MVGLADGLKRSVGAAEQLAAIGLELGSHPADAAEVDGGEAEIQPLLAPFGLDGQAAAGGGADRLDQIGYGLLAARQRRIPHLHDPIARLQAGKGGGLAGLNAGHQDARGGAEARRDPHHHPLGHEHGPGQEQVGDHAGGNHQGPLVQGPVAQQVGVVGGEGAVLVVVGEGHVAPQGDSPQGIDHTAPRALQQGRAEAHREAAHPDSLPGGRQKVARFMDHDQPRQDRQCGENSH